MAYVWLAVLLLASTMGTEAGRRVHKAKKCEKIAVPECENLGYHRTKFPNPFTNITSQEETNNLTRFLPILAQLNCTRTNAMPFLCSVYVPSCTERRPVPIPPCREFCEKAVGSCPALAAMYGIQWPSPLVCSKYPAKKSGQKCISKLKSLRNIKGKKNKKKKPKADGKSCCRLGELNAIKEHSCNMTVTMATTIKAKILRKGLELCKNFESTFAECCTRQVAKIQKRKGKKQERKEKKKERKGKKKQDRKQDRKQKKQNRQDKRKQKQEERKKKKQERKQKKQNRKQKKNPQRSGR